MTDEDLRAIYECLRAIPSAEPGVCVAPGQQARPMLTIEHSRSCTA